MLAMRSTQRAFWIASLLLAWMPAVRAADAPAIPLRDTFSDTWAVTDALGRGSPDGHERPYRADRAVAIFYFLWMQERKNQKVYDISRILTGDPHHLQFGPENSFHWWGEPRLGYYLSNDRFVIERHAQMLSDAGVDIIVCDVSNGLTYDDTLMSLCKTYEQLRALGRRTPRIAFIAKTNAPATVEHLYQVLYSKNLYSDLWYTWEGKPLMLAPAEGLSPELCSFFNVRESWAWTDAKGWFKDGKDKWPWLDHTPQKPGWHARPDVPEEISVAVAEHPIWNIGRSFHDGHEPPADQMKTAEGLYFAEQWSRALEVDPPLVFVAGWNEWIAQRFVRSPKRNQAVFLGKPLDEGSTLFVDEYNEEYSRDIEPMQGGHGDDYYYELVQNIRKYKGVHPQWSAAAPATLTVGGGFGQWDAISLPYIDDLGDVAARDHQGFDAATTYTNHSGRNDLAVMKVAHDKSAVFFYARTRQPLTPPTGHAWMLLFIDSDGDHRDGWEGYDLVINRTLTKTAEGWTGSIERSDNGWAWKTVGECRLEIQDNQLQLAIPRELLRSGAGKLTLDFKWADGLPEEGDPAAFIDQGDVAPNGRFNYRYVGN